MKVIPIVAEGFNLNFRVGDELMFDGMQHIFRPTHPESKKELETETKTSTLSASVERKEWTRIQTHGIFNVRSPKTRGAFSPKIEIFTLKKIKP